MFENLDLTNVVITVAVAMFILVILLKILKFSFKILIGLVGLSIAISIFTGGVEWVKPVVGYINDYEEANNINITSFDKKWVLPWDDDGTVINIEYNTSKDDNGDSVLKGKLVLKDGELHFVNN